MKEGTQVNGKLAGHSLNRTCEREAPSQAVGGVAPLPATVRVKRERTRRAQDETPREGPPSAPPPVTVEPGLRPNAADAKLLLSAGDVLELDVLRFKGEEELGRLYRFDITVAIPEELADVVDQRDCVGEPASLRLMPPDGNRRTIRGVISNCECTGVGRRHVYFVFRLSPPAWRLTQRVNARIFQEKTTEQIITAVLADHGLAHTGLCFALKEEYLARDYCVQYRESDWNFIQRLMEEEGMYHFYREKDGEAVLHITDGAHGHFDLPFGRDVTYHQPDGLLPHPGTVHELRARRQIRPGRVVQSDYANRKPRMPLSTAAEAESNGLEIFDFPGQYRDVQLGRRLTNVRLQERRSGRDRARGRSTRMDFGPGRVLELRGHPLQRFNHEFLITRVRHRCVTPMAAEVGYAGETAGRRGDGSVRPSYANEFLAIPAADVFRPKRKTPRPVSGGPQTAVVVGPEGEEIYTDRYGRVKVRFHWDRGEQLARDERKQSDASCWIRVSQPWAGPGFGGLTIPRIGQEVIVDFLEGDPNQPVITGRVYNGDKMPPTSMAAPARMTARGPEPIPAMQNRPQSLPESASRTTIRTNSTPGGGGGNEIGLEDAAGSELFFVNATKDHVLTVGNDSTTTVGNNHKTSVGVNLEEFVGANRDRHVGANESVNVEGDRSVTVKGNEIHTVNMCRAQQVMIAENILTGVSKTVQTGLSHIETIGLLHALVVGLQRVGVVGMNDDLIVGGDKSDTICGNRMIAVAAEMGVNVGAKMVIECPDITLKAGGGFVRINGDGVTIKGTKVKMNCAGAAPGELSGGLPGLPGGGGGTSGTGTGGGTSGTGTGGGSTGGIGGVLAGLGLPSDLGEVLDALGLPGGDGLLDGLGIPKDSPLRDILGKIGGVLSRIPGIDPKLADMLDKVLNNKLPNFDDILDVVRDELPKDAQKWFDEILDAIKSVKNPPTLPGPRPKGFPNSTPPFHNFWPEGGGSRLDGKTAGDGGSPTANGNTAEEASGAESSQEPAPGPETGAGSQSPSPPRDHLELSVFASEHGFTVTSTTGGTHNPGSAHYQGRAIDVRTRDKSDAEVEAFIAEARRRGIHVRDERTRPPGQQEWSGPHLHLEVR